MIKFQNKYRIPSARAQWWNYGDDGAYFITICTAHMECYFGEIIDSVVVLSELGEIVQKYWLEIPEHFSYVKLDTFVVMPNHFHGIIIIDKPANKNDLAGTPDNVIMHNNVKTSDNVKTLDNVITPDNVETPNLGVSTKTYTGTNAGTETDSEPVKCGGKNDKWQKGMLGVVINQFKRKCTIECRRLNTAFGWQSRFHDTIIRDQESYNTISNYIINNPTKWEDDKLHPSKP